MINVVVVEDNDNIREGLKILIDGADGYTCLGAFSKCETLFNNLKNISPDVLLIDIGLPGISGIDGIRQIKTVLPDLTILVLTIYEENDLIFNALCAGASGYIVKKTPTSKLLRAIRDAYEGYTPFSSNIARKVIELFSEKDPAKVGQQKKQIKNDAGKDKLRLTKHEKEILNKLVEGNSFKAIADSLPVNAETLQSDFRNIYKKLHLYSKQQII